MSKKHSNAGIGSDNWLYIATHALSLFREEGGVFILRPSGNGITIEIPGIFLGDSRLNEGFSSSAELEEVLYHASKQ